MLRVCRCTMRPTRGSGRRPRRRERHRIAIAQTGDVRANRSSVRLVRFPSRHPNRRLSIMGRCARCRHGAVGRTAWRRRCAVPGARAVLFRRAAVLAAYLPDDDVPFDRRLFECLRVQLRPLGVAFRLRRRVENQTITEPIVGTLRRANDCITRLRGARYDRSVDERIRRTRQLRVPWIHRLIARALLQRTSPLHREPATRQDSEAISLLPMPHRREHTNASLSVRLELKEPAHTHTPIHLS